MASSVFLRHSLAAAKRPFIPLQLGTSCSIHPRPPPYMAAGSIIANTHTHLHTALSLSLTHSLTHSHNNSTPFNLQLCLRSRWPYVPFLSFFPTNTSAASHPLTIPFPIRATILMVGG